MADGRGLIKLKEILGITGGRLVSRGGEEVSFTGVSIDSRNIRQGSIFVPLKGENTDGHLYIIDSLNRGAAGSFVSEEFWNRKGASFFEAASAEGAVLIIVPEPLAALQQLGRDFLRRAKGMVRIGVTGSSGKTTTKELISAILSKKAPTWRNEGNFNSEIGLPLACLSLNTGYSYGVFEMGMNKPGEIELLADIVKPHMAVITNIGSAHIGFFGSVEKIAEQKKQIFSRFTGDETGFVFEEDAFADYLSENVNGKILRYGSKSTPGFIEAHSLGLRGYRVVLEEGEFNFPIPGGHNLNNLLCAISVSRSLGADFGHIKAGSESCGALSGRSEIEEGEITLFKDFYNANRDSVEKALSFAEGLPWRGEKVLVLGAMKELGEKSGEIHRDLGARIDSSKWKKVLFFGAEMKDALEAFNGPREILYFTESYEDLEKEFIKSVSRGDFVLIKGSRSMMLERLAEAVKRNPVGGERKC